MSQAHGEATDKLTSPCCQWVWAATSNMVPLLGLTGHKGSDLTSKKMSPDGL